jgi:hypothetical protein
MATTNFYRTPKAEKKTESQKERNQSRWPRLQSRLTDKVEFFRGISVYGELRRAGYASPQAHIFLECDSRTILPACTMALCWSLGKIHPGLALSGSCQFMDISQPTWGLSKQCSKISFLVCKSIKSASGWVEISYSVFHNPYKLRMFQIRDLARHNHSNFLSDFSHEILWFLDETDENGEGFRWHIWYLAGWERSFTRRSIPIVSPVLASKFFIALQGFAISLSKRLWIMNSEPESVFSIFLIHFQFCTKAVF